MERDFPRPDSADAGNTSAVSPISVLAYGMGEFVDAEGLLESGIYPNPMSWGLGEVALWLFGELAGIVPLAGVRGGLWQVLQGILSRAH